MTMPKVLIPSGIQARKRFGQHFLVRRSILETIAERAGLDADATVVEIGAGTGNLTRELSRRAGKVYALEFDRDLAEGLREELEGSNVEVIQADALQFDFSSLKPERGAFKIVGNLPFNISVPLIFRLIEHPGLCPELLLMVQKEVADRITAAPGGKSYGVLAVLCQMLADTEVVLRVAPSAFRPAPKVHSALVRFRRLDQTRYPVPDWGFFKLVVKAGLGQRRKIVANALKGSPLLDLPPETIVRALSQAGIEPTRRAQTLTLAEFSELARILFRERSANHA
ncbi:MAG: ribosomal RNA small subunit methyltransferase A [Deltaproteobacteria bacterium RBG_13_61_14]|nr:MAG: ribosomal RNA small subunit methyltransferase A [Deltaproteobacteria bacterium RBG_13_61_14]